MTRGQHVDPSGGHAAGDHGGLGPAAAMPLPPAYHDPANWRCPLLSGLAPPGAIQRLVRDVEALAVTPWHLKVGARRDPVAPQGRRPP